MIFSIARKEFLTSILTFRFAFAFGACVCLMGLSAYILVDEFALRVDAHQAQLMREKTELDNITVYAQLLEYQPFTYRRPSPLSIFSEGIERRLGNVLHFSHGYVPTMLTWPKESNPLMDAFPAFDLATVARLLLSLMALFFAYDAISGERQAGTLALLATNPIARSQILLGKWLGGLLCTCVPAVAGFLVALLVMVNEPTIHLTGDEWLRAAAIVATTFLCLSVFYLVGLCLSVRVERPATCLLLAISIWALVTVIVPTTTSYLVGELTPMEGEKAAMQERKAAERRIGYQLGGLGEIIRQDGPGGWGRMGGAFLRDTRILTGYSRELYPQVQAFYAEYEPRRIVDAEEIGRLEDHVLADRVAQVELNRTIGRFTIVPSFTGAAAALAGTDLASFHHFVQHARRCRQNLIAWLRESDIFASPLYFTTDSVDRALTRQERVALLEEIRERKDLSREEGQAMWRRATGATDYREWDPVDLSRLPAFPPYRPTLSEILPGVALDLAVLGLANVVLLLLSLLGFLRRELV